MIYVVSGKPRSGKSYWLTVLVGQILRTTDRCIWTNLPLEIEAMAESLCPEGIDVLGRVHVEPDLAKARRFWRYRMKLRSTNPPDPYRPPTELPTVTVDDGSGDGAGGKPLVVIDTSTHDQYADMLYIIDEAHLAFGAREWAKHGPQMLYYFSQHGKLGPSQQGDEVYLATQSPTFLDSQIRHLVQEWISMRNLALVNVLTFFRMPKKVRYRKSETPVWSSASATGSGSFVINPLVEGTWYRTTSGVGVVGSKKGTCAKAHEAKGIPIWIGIAAFVIGLPLAGWSISRSFLWFMKPKRPVATVVAVTNPPVAALVANLVESVSTNVEAIAVDSKPVSNPVVSLPRFSCQAIIEGRRGYAQVWVRGEERPRDLRVRGSWEGDSWRGSDGSLYALEVASRPFVVPLDQRPRRVVPPRATPPVPALRASGPTVVGRHGIVWSPPVDVSADVSVDDSTEFEFDEETQ